MHPCAALRARALAYLKCPCSSEALGPHALASLTGWPRLASLPLCVSAAISEPADASLDGKGHPRPASALRRSATPVSCPLLTRCIRRPTPSSWPFYMPRPSSTAS
ncbi:UNVERIFIED_CONTAM: hypothetical protein Slati_3055800 [Sesamum latifolium]|uniref:Uncharacterized protein n=1 Tax=Sesamum latifolium TaxID=2727402 RepID=A0AAW2UTY3_9LAMI